MLWVWFGLAVMALIAELLSGTFYMLLVAFGLAASGIVAYFGFSLAAQVATCSIIGMAGLVILKKTGVLLKKGHLKATSDSNVNLDIGQHVEVKSWTDNRTSTVYYRGAQWQVKLDPSISEAPLPGQYVIVDIQSVTLVLKPVHKSSPVPANP
ncbi:NfeD family protein [Advenella sp. WQ 585]|uniref:NfeD family protein n=1 Tax=Advenella mandrilli TaxID=2800330 RepID=A0ABS1EBF1_9BURK|nr:NfeD family protein [Advenella mandrilli]MBK1781232.1 NfeD family protein [Advenella mandrilli]